MNEEQKPQLSDDAGELKQKLPPFPYFGLAQYGTSDSPLFAGREADVEACAEIIAQVETRILLLHGQTGCGKSSFLKAGLIPALENRGFGYAFLKSRTQAKDGKESVAFVRSGDDPLSNVAREVFRHLMKPIEVMTTEGNEQFDLRAALDGAATEEEFALRCQQPEVLVEVFREIAHVPATLVIVIDQIEEVLTLNAPDSANRRRFFAFLKLFNVTSVGAKLVLSIRKDHSGEFIGLVQLDNDITADFKVYLLPDMQFADVLRAVLLPTSRVPIGNYGSPYDEYKFEFADGVASNIVRELFDAVPSGAILPIVQIVFRDLYDLVKEKSPPRVIDSTYFDRSKVGVIIKKHISRSLLASFDYLHLGQAEGEAEEKRWRKVLYSFVRYEGDGRVHTDVLSHHSFGERAQEEGVVADLARVLAYLVKPEVLVLREVGLQSAIKKGDQEMLCLGHDIVGLSLYELKVEDDVAARLEEEQRQKREQLEREQRRKRRIRIVGSLIIATALVSGGLVATKSRDDRRAEVERLILRSVRHMSRNPKGGLRFAIQAIETSLSPGLPDERTSQKARRHLASVLSSLPNQNIQLGGATNEPNQPKRRFEALVSPTGFVSVQSDGGIELARVTPTGIRSESFKTVVSKFSDMTSLSVAEPFAGGVVVLLSSYGVDYDRHFEVFVARPKELLGPYGISELLAVRDEGLAPKNAIRDRLPVQNQAWVSLNSDAVVISTQEPDGKLRVTPLFINRAAGGGAFVGGLSSEFPRSSELLLGVCRGTTLNQKVEFPSRLLVGSHILAVKFAIAEFESCPSRVELAGFDVSSLTMKDDRGDWVQAVEGLPVISRCREESWSCTYEVSIVSRMTVLRIVAKSLANRRFTLGSKNSGSSVDSEGVSYILIDSDKGSIRYIEEAAIEDARIECSMSKGLVQIVDRRRLGKQSEVHGVIDGTVDDLAFIFPSANSVQVVRTKGAGSELECQEKVFLVEKPRRWRYSPADRTLVAISENDFLVWSLQQNINIDGTSSSELLAQAKRIHEQ